MTTALVHDQIRMRLIADFAPLFVEVSDDSARHQGHQALPPGTRASHFHVKMASAAFKGQPLIQRHRAVYQSLEGFLKNGVHALQMELFSAEEWHARGSD